MNFSFCGFRDVTSKKAQVYIWLLDTCIFSDCAECSSCCSIWYRGKMCTLGMLHEKEPSRPYAGFELVTFCKHCSHCSNTAWSVWLAGMEFTVPWPGRKPPSSWPRGLTLQCTHSYLAIHSGKTPVTPTSPTPDRADKYITPAWARIGRCWIGTVVWRRK